MNWWQWMSVFSFAGFIITDDEDYAQLCLLFAFLSIVFK
jgi:hypothetical protein